MPRRNPARHPESARGNHGGDLLPEPRTRTPELDPEEVSMSRLVHFEIQADDVERAKSFYAAAFG